MKQAQTKITETISNKYIQKLQKIGVSKKIVRNLMAILKPFLKNSRCSNDYNSTILLTENWDWEHIGSVEKPKKRKLSNQCKLDLKSATSK